MNFAQQKMWTINKSSLCFRIAVSFNHNFIREEENKLCNNTWKERIIAFDWSIRPKKENTRPLTTTPHLPLTTAHCKTSTWSISSRQLYTTRRVHEAFQVVLRTLTACTLQDEHMKHFKWLAQKKWISPSHVYQKNGFNHWGSFSP